VGDEGATLCRMRAFLMAMVVLAGCGGSGGANDAAELPGTWAVGVGSCDIGMTFASGMTYEHDIVCVLPNGASSGLQTEIGTYSATGTRLTFLVAKATCPAAQKNYYVDYSIDGGRLVLIYSDGVEVMERFSPSGTALAAFGCYDSSGTFTPGPLAPL
jgi:hypothetical protein